MPEVLTETPRAGLNAKPQEPSAEQLAIETLTRAVGENAALQAELHRVFATHLLEFRNALRSVHQSIKNLEDRVDRVRSTEIAPASPATTPSAVRVAQPTSSQAKTTPLPSAPSAPGEPFLPSRFEVVNHAPVWMTMSERVLLYGLIAGLRPRRCLEVGTFKGGSALIITAALDDLGEGRLACVDPNAQILPEHWRSIAHRAALFQGPSPDVLPQASQAVGGKFDFALIDGDHSTEGVIRDIHGVLPHLENLAYLLFHDAHNADVIVGIDRCLREPSNHLTDCGLLSTEKTSDAAPGVFWGGLRLLRFDRNACQ